MSSTLKKSVAGIAALALAGIGLAATAAPASAAYVSTAPPAYNNGTTVDPASAGSIALYDAAGNRVVGGSLTNLGGAIYAVASNAPRTGANKATLSVAAPDHTKVSSLWASQGLTASTNFPVAGSIPNVSTATGPVATLNGTTDGNVSSFLSVAVLDATAGYQGYLQLRIKDSGPGVAAATTWATMEIAFDTAAGTWTQVYPTVTYTATTTSAPTFSPVSPATNGDNVTLSATVSPSSATGSVHFFDGSTDLGAATFSGGTATLTHVFTNTTNPKVNENHSITASSASTLVVQPTPLIVTTTTVALNQATVTLGSTDVLTATATVTPASGATPTGSVAFYVDGSSTANATATLTAGSTGAVTINFSGLTGSSSPGTAHTIVATYTDANTWAGSSSAASTVNVIASYAADIQNIQTSISAGTLVISTPYTAAAPLVLPAMTLNSTATEYSTAAAFTGISVADTRPGNLAYTLSAIASNLTKQGVASPTANQTINAQNVGLDLSALTSTNATPNTFLGSQTPGAATTAQNFTGFNNAAAAHVAAGDTGSAGLGGASPHVVLHANNGLGTTVTNGTLTIKAPSNTLDGTYAGTITFSIIGS
jgi:hypothetical protein